MRVYQKIQRWLDTTECDYSTLSLDNNNFKIYSDTLYSYGDHWPLAYRFKTARGINPLGELDYGWCLLINRATYSGQTAITTHHLYDALANTKTDYDVIEINGKTHLGRAHRTRNADLMFATMNPKSITTNRYYRGDYHIGTGINHWPAHHRDMLSQRSINHQMFATLYHHRPYRDDDPIVKLLNLDTTFTQTDLDKRKDEIHNHAVAFANTINKIQHRYLYESIRHKDTQHQKKKTADAIMTPCIDAFVKQYMDVCIMDRLPRAVKDLIADPKLDTLYEAWIQNKIDLNKKIATTTNPSHLHDEQHIIKKYQRVLKIDDVMLEKQQIIKGLSE